MFGDLSYLYSTLFLTVPIIFLEWVFYYHLLKKNLYPILITTLFGLVIVSISEPLGIYLKAWEYGATTTLPTFYLGVKLESYVYVTLCSVGVGSLTMIYATYQDMKIKNIVLQGIKDFFSARYAFWRSE
ncbi:hypothetical protein KBD81_00935 [Candidatus Woesebacteria bacterium]|nr:hypothetical protein [Candidatus Woesebacteria bacterium]